MWRAQLCLFSGPLVNLLLSLLFITTNPVLHVVGMLNLPFALFNLPLPRSDGWQMWKATTGATRSGAAALEARVWICGRDS
jgi:Zn-dependent protease